jgi:hypothetical protein
VDYRLVRGREAIRLKKAVTVAGEWKVRTGKGGQMPRSAFPLSSRNAIILGRKWHWRVDDLQGDGHAFRLLTAFDPSHEEFRAWLGLRGSGSTLTVLACLEFHGNHPGWHCHANCDEIGKIETGEPHPRKSVRIPDGERRHRRKSFEGMSEATALAASFKFFRVTGAPKGSMI